MKNLCISEIQEIEIGVTLNVIFQGHSRSNVMIHWDSPHMTCYRVHNATTDVTNHDQAKNIFLNILKIKYTVTTLRSARRCNGKHNV